MERKCVLIGTYDGRKFYRLMCTETTIVLIGSKKHSIRYTEDSIVRCCGPIVRSIDVVYQYWYPSLPSEIAANVIFVASPEPFARVIVTPSDYCSVGIRSGSRGGCVPVGASLQHRGVAVRSNWCGLLLLY